ncbi:hypothetical protein JCM19237_723 [Photobacterium aphoticum]|uniref:Uncharacterized protein n=1 Tax=Photobacterium aphoticum TaxID=754436 RepID=A0A090R2Z2_9GAMM|nr:hypothetical protein JCM19237_723 [Photobacterium aphoticum]
MRQHPIWAARLRFPRLDATLLHQLAILRDTPFSIESVPARRWACYALRQDNLHRSAHLGEDVQQGITVFFQQPLAAPFRAFPYVIIELREHHQYATSTFPLALAFAVEPDTPIPPAMFEIHQPERTELRLTMPCADFIPALLYHLPVRSGRCPIFNSPPRPRSGFTVTIICSFMPVLVSMTRHRHATRQPRVNGLNCRLPHSLPLGRACP